MKKLDISDFNCSISSNGILYVVEVKNNNYIIKRIKDNKNSKTIDIISIIDGYVYFNNYVYIDNLKLENKINYFEIIEIIDNILEDICNNNIIKDFLDINKLSNYIKNNFMNYLISNGILALTQLNKNTLNIVLLETNNIIGSINLDLDKINIDNYFYKESLNLYKNYLKLFKTEEKILKLK